MMVALCKRIINQNYEIAQALAAVSILPIDSRVLDCLGAEK